jgi:ParB/RepB/Spo0J family partition protein
MAKIGSGTGLKKIPLSRIVDTGNVRENYESIEELAESILRHGQLEPALVKAAEPDEDGERFEIIAGHRRLRAVRLLCGRGEGVTTIDALVITGDKLTIQLVENLQRSDLTAEERERGISQLCQNGLSQRDAAARLSKPEGYISRNVSAHKIREAAYAAGIDAGGLATATLNEIQAAKPGDYPDLVREILNNGGTSEAARVVMENYRVSHGKPANPKAKGGLSDSLALHPSPVTDPVVEELSENGVDVNIDINTDEASNKWIDDYEPPPHRQVDFNTICVAIMNYAEKYNNIITNCEKARKECDTCADCGECDAFSRVDAVHDILAILHKEL